MRKKKEKCCLGIAAFKTQLNSVPVWLVYRLSDQCTSITRRLIHSDGDGATEKIGNKIETSADNLIISCSCSIMFIFLVILTGNLSYNTEREEGESNGVNSAVFKKKKIKDVFLMKVVKQDILRKRVFFKCNSPKFMEME